MNFWVLRVFRNFLPFQLFLLLVGCAAPQVTGNFTGINQILKSPKVNIILVHGMSSHDPGWSDEFVNKLAKYLGYSTVGSNWSNCTYIKGEGLLTSKGSCPNVDTSNSVNGVLRKITFKSPSNENTVTFTEITWSPTTSALKQQLVYDSEKSLSSNRALFNKMLKKGLVNDGLSDAVAYTGSSGPKIRDVIWKGICFSMTEKLENPNLCNFEESFREQFIFITHSLGSRIVFDTLHGADEDSKILSNQIKEMKVSVTANTSAMYMFANQLPLLQMALDPKSSAYANRNDSLFKINEFIDDRNSAIEDINSKNHKIMMPSMKYPLSIGVFSDPNDLLSYPLCGSTFKNDEITKFADIRVKNAFDFYLFANPMQAHKGYWKNDDVTRLIADGSAGNKLNCPSNKAP